jgi:hypothetical protein
MPGTSEMRKTATTNSPRVANVQALNRSSVWPVADAVPPAKAVDLARRLLSRDTASRSRAADEVTDYVTAYSNSLGDHALAIGSILVLARMAETDPEAAESQLNALASLHDWGAIPSISHQHLRNLEASSLPPDEAEHLDYLLSE